MTTFSVSLTPQDIRKAVELYLNETLFSARVEVSNIGELFDNFSEDELFPVLFKKKETPQPVLKS